MIFEYFAVNLAGLLGALYLLFFITKKTGDWFTFAHFFSVIWGIMLVFSQVSLNGLVRPEVFTIVVLYGSWWSFLIGSLVVLSVYGNNNKCLKQKINKHRSLMIVFFVMIMQLIAILLENRFNIFNSLNFSELIQTLVINRITNIYQQVDLPWYVEIWRWGHIYYIPITFMLFSRKYIGKYLFIGILIFSLLASFSRFTRAPFTQLIVFLFISWLIFYRPKKAQILKSGVFLSILGIVVFIAIQYAIISSNPNSKVDLGESLATYLAAPPKAFEIMMTFPNTYQNNGFYSLDFVNFFLYRLDLINSYPDLIRPIVFTPIITNLYTFLDAFYLDFGLLGALLGSLIIGSIAAYSYNRLHQSITVFNLIIYCYFTYSCIMASANNEFIRSAVPLLIAITFMINLFVGRRSSETTKGINSLNIPLRVKGIIGEGR